MAAQAAVKYANNYDYGTAAPAGGYYGDPRLKESAIPVAQPTPAVKVRPQHRYGISLFAITGAVFIAVLMVFIVLAYVNYIEVTNETVKLESRLIQLNEQGRRLEIKYEQVFDMSAVERYAIDVLGMTKPEIETVSVAQTVEDKAEIISVPAEKGVLSELGSFLSTLLEYFK